MRRITGILLAAGKGTRFGGQKLLATLDDGTPLLLAAGRRLFGIVPDSIVVLKPEDHILAELCAAESWRAVICADAQKGMGHSLACGVAATAASDAWLIALADMPCIKEETYREINRELVAGSDCAAPFHAGQRGHPVGISARFRDELLALRGESGARDILSHAGPRLARVDVDDPGIFIDVDVAADLATATDAS